MIIKVNVDKLFDFDELFDEDYVLDQKVYTVKKIHESDFKDKIEDRVVDAIIKEYFGNIYNFGYGSCKYDNDIKLAWHEFMENHKTEIIEKVSDSLFRSLSKKVVLKEDK